MQETLHLSFFFFIMDFGIKTDKELIMMITRIDFQHY
jgi:hypothetical protein